MKIMLSLSLGGKIIMKRLIISLFFSGSTGVICLALLAKMKHILPYIMADAFSNMQCLATGNPNLSSMEMCEKTQKGLFRKCKWRRRISVNWRFVSNSRYGVLLA